MVIGTFILCPDDLEDQAALQLRTSRLPAQLRSVFQLLELAPHGGHRADSSRSPIPVGIPGPFLREAGGKAPQK